MNKTPLLFSAIGLFAVAGWSRADETLTVFAAAATLPVVQTIPAHFEGMGFVDDKLVSKTLKGADLINLALGRPLGTRIDKKKEVLALALATEGPGEVATPSTRIIVYNPDETIQNDPDRIVATVFTLTELNYNAAVIGTKANGQGIGTVAAMATLNPPPDPAGDATKNALFATSLDGAATATATISPMGTVAGFKITLKGLGGRLHFKYTDAKNPAPVEIDGVAIKGVFTTTGKPLHILTLP